MTKLSWNEIQERAVEFASKWEGETYEKGESQSFWSDFLTVFGVDRRRHGAYFEYAIKKGNGKQGFIDMFWPGKLLAEQKSGGKDLSKASIQAYEYLETMPDHDLPQAIVVSDFSSFQFIRNDGTNEKVEFALADLSKHVKLFAFLIGEKSQNLAEENPVNRQAAEAMANLHNQLRDDNYTGHDLEVLLVRLVFCLFADDSGIFEHNALFHYLDSRTSDDGSDFGPRLMQVFQALNTPLAKRQSSLDEDIAALPYVNGGLFAESINTPYFTSKMRSDLLATMQLDWSKVSPAIFGSMFQGVMDEKQRRNLGAHYTSEKNILRVIKPLFLDELYDEFAAAVASGPRKKFKELETFHDKIANLTFLDPACGAGNFLVITYRELRKLEHKVLAILSKGEQTMDMFASAGSGIGTLKVNVDQMYGIEIEEFPSLIAQAALWLTDHQMNMEYSAQSGKAFKRIPLTVSATIVNDNALTKDWAEVVTPNDLNYILGNPPFLGTSLQDNQQKEAFASVCSILPSFGVLDFVAAWYIKAATYMQSNKKVKTALVSTNSITQGEQVPVLWKYLFGKGIHVNFAHQTFKWSNDAKGNAAVYCVIVGFSFDNNGDKQIYEYPDIKAEPVVMSAQNINAYLVDAPTVIIESRSKPLSGVPTIKRGNSPYDGGNFLFDEQSYLEFIKTEPESIKYFKKFVGAKEYLNSTSKYCLWLVGANPADLRKLPEVMNVVNQVKIFRETAKGTETRQYATTPTTFRDKNAPYTFIVIPRVSSERRDYIPICFYDDTYIPGDTVMIVASATIYHFGVLTSQMHMAWMRTVAGRLKSDYRYSKDIVYNNFIWPNASESQKIDIERLTQNILDARTEFPGTSLADLYDPLTMPPQLSKAHKALDRAVDRLYQIEPFATDAERVALLFEKYQEVTK